MAEKTIGIINNLLQLKINDENKILSSTKSIE